jgi:hypothetical protein
MNLGTLHCPISGDPNPGSWRSQHVYRHLDDRQE